MTRPKRLRHATSRFDRLRFERLEGRLLLTTYLVTSAGSTGPNTLAAAIILSDADTNQTNTIDFNIAGTGTQTIALTAPLPTITQAVKIDATTQPGYVANTATTGDNEVPAIIIDGTNAGLGVPGVDFLSTATGSSLLGLQIEKFTGDALDVGANNVTVSADLIGVGPSGTDSTGLGNGGIGVSVQNSTGVTISGVDVGSSGGYGVFLSSSPGATLTGVTVTGTLASGSTPGDGIRIDASDHVTMTGVTASGNAGIGVNISGTSGLFLDTSTVQSNQGGGLALVNSDEKAGSAIQNSTIGGATAGLGNGVVGVLISNANEVSLGNDLIADNAGAGVLDNAGSAGSDGAPTIGFTTITGNAGDGLDVSNSITLTLEVSIIQGNKGNGVYLTNQATGSEINASTIGGTAAGQANGGLGLLVVGSDKLDILDSPIIDAAGFGIELYRSDLATLTGVTVAGTTKLGADLGDGVLSVLSRSLVMNGGSITGNAGIGINLDQSASASVQGATVATNVGGGVNLYASGSATVSGTTVGGTVTGVTPAPGNGIVGIQVNGSTNASITGNVVAGNQGNGVAILTGSTSTLVSGGTISGNSDNGVVIYAPMATITGVLVSANGAYGIDSTADGDGLLVGGATAAAGNQVSSNGSAGIGVANAANATITNNTATSNASSGIEAYSDDELTLTDDTATLSRYENGVTLGNAKASGSISFKGPVTGLVCSSNAAYGLEADLVTGLQLIGDTFDANRGGGASLDADGFVVGNSRFDGNEFQGLGVIGGIGFTIGGTAGPVEISNTMRLQNSAVGPGDGLDLTGTNFSISNLTITGSQGSGISAYAVAGGMISATTIGGATVSLGNAGVGLLSFNSNGMTLGLAGAPVVVENNQGIGIQLRNSSNGPPLSNDRLTNLTVEANGSTGLDLENITGTTLTNSTIEYQGGVGVSVLNSDNTTLSGNTISGNTGQNIVVTNSKNFVNND